MDWSVFLKNLCWDPVLCGRVLAITSVTPIHFNILTQLFFISANTSYLNIIKYCVYCYFKFQSDKITTNGRELTKTTLVSMSLLPVSSLLEIFNYIIILCK